MSNTGRIYLETVHSDGTVTDHISGGRGKKWSKDDIIPPINELRDFLALNPNVTNKETFDQYRPYGWRSWVRVKAAYKIKLSWIRPATCQPDLCGEWSEYAVNHRDLFFGGRDLATDGMVEFLCAGCMRRLVQSLEENKRDYGVAPRIDITKFKNVFNGLETGKPVAAEPYQMDPTLFFRGDKPQLKDIHRRDIQRVISNGKTYRARRKNSKRKAVPVSG